MTGIRTTLTEAGVSNDELTAREMRIAEMAAELAVKKVTEQFYAQVGRSVFNKLLILLGAIFVGWAAGKGLIKFV